MQTDLDLIIIGAGCAGLSLGVRLARMGKRAPKTLLLEQRKAYENDRTWCFWGQHGDPYSDLANHQWTQFIVQAEKRAISLDCAFAPYHILSSQTFYNDALQSIGLNPLIELRMNSVLLKEPQFHQGWWEFETSAGQMRAKSVVDTRPKAANDLQGTKLWQSFLGYEIECEEAIFDPKTATLMDFSKANSEFVGFNYVLPQTEKRALIEFTVFAKRPYIQNELLSRLDESVIQYLGDKKFKILRQEFGLIPMGLATDPTLKNIIEAHPTYVYVGLTAGAARPATGYAFQRIQEWAAQCANSLLKKGLPITHVADSFLLRKMDDVFLNVIRNNPALGPELFLDLFAKVNSRKLVRFLSDRGHLLDYLAIVKALPAAPFLKDIFSFSYIR
jgi:lycopene beta-cyclase